MTTFLDTSALYAALDRADAQHSRAAEILAETDERVVSDHILVELWRLLRLRVGRDQADEFVAELATGGVIVEAVGIGDLQRALEIGTDYPDQDFSLVDRTSFAVMRRLGIHRVATFDHHFAVFRFGPGRRRAFEIAR